LERNKIFFETLAAILLSAMAIMVSCQSNRIASVQMKLAERQTAIADELSQPFFRAAVVLQWDSTSQKYIQDRLAVINDGAPAYNPLVKVAQFLAVRCPQSNADSLIPIRGYYQSAVLTGRRTDTLVEFSGRLNRQRLYQLYRSYLARPATAQNPQWTGQRIFLRLNYLDRTSRPQVRFFEVLEPGGAALLDSAVGGRLMARFDSLWSRPAVDLETASPDSVAALCADK
jgi:hypothetical protein